MGANGEVSLTVAGIFEDGQILRDAYTGQTAKVTGGKVSLKADQYVLLERVQAEAH